MPLPRFRVRAVTLAGKVRLPPLRRPPKVGVLTVDEKARVPVPEVSNALCWRARLLPNWSVPPLISVLPVNVSVPERTCVPAPVLVRVMPAVVLPSAPE